MSSLSNEIKINSDRIKINSQKGPQREIVRKANTKSEPERKNASEGALDRTTTNAMCDCARAYEKSALF